MSWLEFITRSKEATVGWRQPTVAPLTRSTFFIIGTFHFKKVVKSLFSKNGPLILGIGSNNPIQQYNGFCIPELETPQLHTLLVFIDFCPV